MCLWGEGVTEAEVMKIHAQCSACDEGSESIKHLLGVRKDKGGIYMVRLRP